MYLCDTTLYCAGLVEVPGQQRRIHESEARPQEVRPCRVRLAIQPPQLGADGLRALLLDLLLLTQQAAWLTGLAVLAKVWLTAS